jgi:hypothetical protein
MSAPPVTTGAVQMTIADPLDGVAETAVGALGIVAGVTELLGVEDKPVPILLVAVTVKV